MGPAIYEPEQKGDARRVCVRMCMPLSGRAPSGLRPRKIPKLDQAQAAPWGLRGPLRLHCGCVTLFHCFSVNDVPHEGPSAVRWEEKEGCVPRDSCSAHRGHGPRRV